MVDPGYSFISARALIMQGFGNRTHELKPAGENIINSESVFYQRKTLLITDC